MSWLLGIWITAVNRSKYTVSILPPDKWYIQTTTSTSAHYHFDNRSHHHHHHHPHPHPHHTHEYYQHYHHHHRNAHDINDNSSSSSSSTSNNDLSNSINRNSTSSITIVTLKGRRVGVGGNRVVGNRNHSASSMNRNHSASSMIIYRQNKVHHRYDITNYDLNDAYLIKSLLRNKRIIFVGDSLSR